MKLQRWLLAFALLFTAGWLVDQAAHEGGWWRFVLGVALLAFIVGACVAMLPRPSPIPPPAMPCKRCGLGELRRQLRPGCFITDAAPWLCDLCGVWRHASVCATVDAEVGCVCGLDHMIAAGQARQPWLEEQP